MLPPSLGSEILGLEDLTFFLYPGALLQHFTASYPAFVSALCPLSPSLIPSPVLFLGSLHTWSCSFFSWKAASCLIAFTLGLLTAQLLLPLGLWASAMTTTPLLSAAAFLTLPAQQALLTDKTTVQKEKVT